MLEDLCLLLIDQSEREGFAVQIGFGSYCSVNSKWTSKAKSSQIGLNTIQTLTVQIVCSLTDTREFTCFLRGCTNLMSDLDQGLRAIQMAVRMLACGSEII